MPTKKYSEKFKKEVIEYAKSGKETMVDVAKKYNIPRMTLYRWLEKENIEKAQEVETVKNNKTEEIVKMLEKEQSEENSSIITENEAKTNKDKNNKKEIKDDIEKIMDSIEQEQNRGFSLDTTGKAVKTIHVNESKKNEKAKADLQHKLEEQSRLESSRKRRKQFKKIKQRIILILLFVVCMFEMYVYKDAIIEKLGMQISRLTWTIELQGVENLQLNNIDISFDKKTKRSTVKLRLTNTSTRTLENLRYTAIFKDSKGNQIVSSTLIEILIRIIK